ncbi:monovalent cation:proton antiporter-2 (CPA2) family protein [Rhodospirillum sp. A1_3_36]|uniref:monovalent cation:proton antiporter-2 (CPA2) family protein n=1 Tax=Rhodospirillum sp. A1_3_36 TaxID=3391666 RepID=UPI0039A727A6
MLVEVLTLLVAAIAAATVFSRLGFGAILGYLVAGAVIGPWGLGLIRDPGEIAHIGEFGVVFLLFLIGIELKPSRLWVMRRLVFGLGGAQVLVSGGALSALASLGLGLDPGPALVAGFGLALSSTAFGVQLLSDRNQLSAQWGRAGFSILLFQDLAVVPLLAMVPLLADTGSGLSMDLGLAIVETLGILVAVILGGRILINPVLKLIASTRGAEVFTGMALLLVLGFGWLMEHAGLSMAMGAFLAGVLLADSEYRHQVEVDIQPFRGLLLGLFFMAVGMGIDLGALVNNWSLILGALVVLLVVKAGLIIGLARLSGLDAAGSLQAGLLLAQAGEFGFVLFAYAGEQGVLAPAVSEPLVSVIALGMAVTPLLAMLGDRLAPRFKNARAADGAEDADPSEDRPVLIAGFGRVGETVARMLHSLGIPCRAIDLDSENVDRGRKAGTRVYYGDASRPEILRAVGAAEARLLVITLDSPRAAERTLWTVRHHFPNLPVHARARDLAMSEHLRNQGAAHAVPETLEASLRLGAEAAKAAKADPAAVADLVRALRGDHYTGLTQAMDEARQESASDASSVGKGV